VSAKLHVQVTNLESNPLRLVKLVILIVLLVMVLKAPSAYPARVAHFLKELSAYRSAQTGNLRAHLVKLVMHAMDSVIHVLRHSPIFAHLVLLEVRDT
jgi:hypothetical protein